LAIAFVISMGAAAAILLEGHRPWWQIAAFAILASVLWWWKINAGRR
jgi:hypothetical protein